jgi:hypothetical protein
MWPKALDHVMHCNADGVHGRKTVIDHAGKQSLRAAELTAQKTPQHFGPGATTRVFAASQLPLVATNWLEKS